MQLRLRTTATLIVKKYLLLFLFVFFAVYDLKINIWKPFAFIFSDAEKQIFIFCIFLPQFRERITKWLIKIMPKGMQKFCALEKKRHSWT